MSHGTNRSNRKRYGNRSHNLRNKIRRETEGRGANLREDFTEGDLGRMEARARAAMERNRVRMGAC